MTDNEARWKPEIKESWLAFVGCVIISESAIVFDSFIRTRETLLSVVSYVSAKEA